MALAFRVEMAFGFSFTDSHVVNDVSYPGPDDADWVDVSSYVNGLGSDRGRNDEFDEIEAGNLSISLDNSDGRFTPERAASPHYPNVKPMTPVRVTASLDNWVTTYPVFTGVVEKWPVKLDNLSSCDVTAVDLFGFLGRSKLRPPLRDRWQSAGAVRLFPLNADTGFSDVLPSGVDAAPFTGSAGGGTVRYDGASFYRGDGIGTGMTIDPSVSTIGTGATFMFAEHSREGAIVFMWQPDERITVNGGDTQTLLNVQFPSYEGYSGHDLLVEARWSSFDNTFAIFNEIPTVGYGASGYVPVIFGKAYLIALSWWEENLGGGTGYVYETSVYDAHTAELVGTTRDERRIYQLSSTQGAPVYLGGKRDGTRMASGQFANLAAFDYGIDPVALLQGITVYPVGGHPSEVDQINETLNRAGLYYLATLDTPFVGLAPLDWQDRKAALTVVQECGADANGLVFPAADGRLRYLPGPSRMAALAGALPALLTDTDDYEPGISLYVDDQNIVNDVTLEFSGGGGLAPGSSNEVSAESVALYGTATSSRSTALPDEGPRRYLAQWLAYTRGQGGIRLDSVTFPLTAASNPAALLGLEIGSRIRLGFPAAAPFSAGDFFIEGVSIDVDVDGGTPEASVTFRLSKVMNQSAWLLEDPIFGVLDTSTRLFTVS